MFDFAMNNKVDNSTELSFATLASIASTVADFYNYYQKINQAPTETEVENMISSILEDIKILDIAMDDIIAKTGRDVPASITVALPLVISNATESIKYALFVNLGEQKASQKSHEMMDAFKNYMDKTIKTQSAYYARLQAGLVQRP
jgi:hypothetical protein